MLATLDDVVKQRAERDRWTDTHDRLAIVAGRVGVMASGHQDKEPVKRIRRPGEPDPDAPRSVSYGEFARMLSSKAA